MPIRSAILILLLLSSAVRAQMMGFGGPSPLEVSATPSSTQVVPGAQDLVIAVVLDHNPGFHVYPNVPVLPEALDGFPATPTQIEVETPEWLSAGRIQWPDEHEVSVNFTGSPVSLRVYEGKAIAFVPIRVASDAPIGSYELPIRVSYQACDATMCFPPTTDELTVTLEVVEAVGDVAASDSDTFGSFDPSVFADESAWGEGAIVVAETPGVSNERKFLGFITLPPIDSPAGIGAIALAAAFGGFVLNLTPCVLPVIPIKIMTITQHAGEHKGRALKLGLSMAIGVVVFWFGIGVPVAFVGGFVDPSIIFGIWWVTGLIGVIIAAMGLGIMGWFSINLPQKVYMVNPKADSVSGSFMFGVMTAVLGLPCFGFVAGALLAGAATMEPWQVMIIFTALGVGMAFPYLVLTLNPGWLSAIPKTGPASELVKQVMGLLMLAAAAYFLGTSFLAIASGQGWALPWWGKSIHWWVVGLLALAAGGWLLIRTISITKRALNLIAFSVLALILAGGGIGAAANQTSHSYHNFWVSYDPDSFDEALESGRVVVLDFTAEWCLNCKTLEATVLSRNPVKPLLLSSDVVPMQADLTAMSAPGWAKLKELKQTGIPLLAVFEPENPDPIWLSNAYSGSQVVDAITQARSQ